MIGNFVNRYSGMEYCNSKFNLVLLLRQLNSHHAFQSFKTIWKVIHNIHFVRFFARPLSFTKNNVITSVPETGADTQHKRPVIKGREPPLMITYYGPMLNCMHKFNLTLYRTASRPSVSCCPAFCTFSRHIPPCRLSSLNDV